MFIGRERELEELNRRYAQKEFQLFIMYGRRRVGKTTLLNEFCKNKNSIFFSAELSNARANLEKFSQVIFHHYGDSSQENFTSVESAFTYIKERQGENRIIVVIDEFPYLAESEPSILSKLQHLIDFKLKESQMYLILCGSYMGFMEREVLGSKSPLFGRRTGQLQLKPFDYLSSAEFMQNFSFEDKLKFYGAFGGTPLYLNQINTEKSFETNITENFLMPTSYLYEEPIFLLREELQQPSTYNSIIEAIACGASKANEIADKTGEVSAKCLKYISVLRELEILYREAPFGEKETSRKTIYGISDFLFRFWYRYVFNNRTLIETGAYKQVLERRIIPDYNTYMGLVFEKVCKEYLLRRDSQGNLPILFTEIGRWWGNDAKRKTQIEIDLIAREQNDYLFCECKWRNSKADLGVLKILEDRAEIFFNGQERKGQVNFMIFSKSGFDDELRSTQTKMQDLILVDLEELFKK